MKSFLILTAVLLICMVSSETQIWGNRVMTDKLLITKDIKKPAQPYTTVSGEVAYKSVINFMKLWSWLMIVFN